MTLNDIKAAVKRGETVHWANAAYVVTMDPPGREYYIVCTHNQHTIGLTHMDGVTMNGKEEDFFIKGTEP